MKKGTKSNLAAEYSIFLVTSNFKLSHNNESWSLQLQQRNPQPAISTITSCYSSYKPHYEFNTIFVTG